MTAIVSLSPGGRGRWGREVVLVVRDLKSDRGMWAPNAGAEVEEIPRCAVRPFIATDREFFTQMRSLPVSFQLLFNKVFELRRPEISGAARGHDWMDERHRNLEEVRMHLSCENEAVSCIVTYALREEQKAHRLVTPQDLRMELRLKVARGEAAQLRYLNMYEPRNMKQGGPFVQVELLGGGGGVSSNSEKADLTKADLTKATAAVMTTVINTESEEETVIDTESEEESEEAWTRRIPTESEDENITRKEIEKSAAAHERVWSKLQTSSSSSSKEVDWMQGSISFVADGCGRSTTYTEHCAVAFGSVDWEMVERKWQQFHTNASRSPRRE